MFEDFGGHAVWGIFSFPGSWGDASFGKVQVVLCSSGDSWRKPQCFWYFWNSWIANQSQSHIQDYLRYLCIYIYTIYICISLYINCMCIYIYMYLNVIIYTNIKINASWSWFHTSPVLHDQVAKVFVVAPLTREQNCQSSCSTWNFSFLLFRL